MLKDTELTRQILAVHWLPYIRAPSKLGFAEISPWQMAWRQSGNLDSTSFRSHRFEEVSTTSFAFISAQVDRDFDQLRLALCDQIPLGSLGGLRGPGDLAKRSTVLHTQGTSSSSHRDLGIRKFQPYHLGPSIICFALHRSARHGGKIQGILRHHWLIDWRIGRFDLLALP